MLGYKPKREHFVDKRATKFADRHSSAVVYASEGENLRTGKTQYYLTGFRGKAQKPAFNFYYRSPEAREAKARSFFAAVRESEQRKAKERKERQALQSSHDVKVGDIFRVSWGYDQTNIQYFQVTKLVGKTMMEVREIGCESEQTDYMQGKSVPAIDRFIGAPERKKIQQWKGGEPYFRFASYASASRMKPQKIIGNKPVYAASHWTAYA